MKTNLFFATLLSLAMAGTILAQSGIPDECDEIYIPPDLNHNNYVNVDDLVIFVSNWLEQDCGLTNSCDGADMNYYDGKVDLPDYFVMSEFWGQCTDSTNPNCSHQQLTLYEPPCTGDLDNDGCLDDFLLLCNNCPETHNPPDEYYDPKMQSSSSIRDFSGEFQTSAVDMRIPGKGFDFIWVRKYRSRTGSDTEMGNRWDHSYNIYLEQCGANLLLYDGNGRHDLYYPQDDGTWAADGFHRVLQQEPDETFTMTLGDKSTCEFRSLDQANAPGRISAITDRNDNSITLDYGPSGRLTTIIDTLGREIEITYGADDYIDTVSADWASLTVTYDHYEAGDPDGSPGDLKSASILSTSSDIWFDEWDTPTQCHGDTDGLTEGTPFTGFYYVGPDDLSALTASFGLSYPDLGYIPGADFDRNGTVNQDDADILNLWYMVKEPPKGPGVPADCPGYSPPQTATTTYTYTTGFGDESQNHNLLTITDPEGQTYLQNTFTDAKLTQQILGDSNDKINITDTSVVPDSSNNYAVTKTVTNDRMGNVTESFYDNLNRLVILRNYTGRADPNLPTYLDPDTNPPVDKLRATDPDYFETRYQYNADSKPTRIDYPNGNYVINVYEADLDPAAPPRSRGNLRQRHAFAGSLDPVSDQSQISEFFEYDDGMGSCCGSNFVTRYLDPDGNETLHDYDAQGNRIQTIYVREAPDPNIVEEWEYDLLGRMTAHILPDNGSGHRRRDEYTYHDAPSSPGDGLLEDTIIDAENLALTTTYEYDFRGNVTSVTDPNGNQTEYEYDYRNRLTAKISPETTDGSSVRYRTEYEYDLNGNLVRIDVDNIDDQGVTDANPRITTTYQYDMLNNRIRTTAEVNETDSVVTEYEYDDNKNLTLSRSGQATNGDQPNNTARILYDERDMVYQVTRAENDPNNRSTTQYDYDDNGNRVTVHKGLEDAPRITIFTYDGYNRLVQTTDPMGNVTEYQYDSRSNRIRTRTEGELLDTTGSAGNVRLSETVYIYDALSRLVRTEVAFFDPNTKADIDDGKATTQYKYSDNSGLVKVVDDGGNETLTTYDTANRKSVVTDAKGNTATYGYDENSNIVTLTSTEIPDPNIPDETFVTAYEYDNLNRLTTVTDNIGSTTEYGYDSRNNKTRISDAESNETRYEYDGLNRLITIARDTNSNGADPADPADIVTTQTHDDNSRLTGRTDDKGNTTTYQYDALDRLVKTIYADGTSGQAAYDVHSNPIETTDAAANKVDYAYDYLNRLIAKSITPGPGVSGDTTIEFYMYDGFSRVVYAEDDDSVVMASYDSLSNVTEENLNGQTTAYTYDGLGNKLSTTYPGGRAVTYTYDAIDRIKTISDTAGSIANYDYIGPSRPAQRDYANGTRMVLQYDGARRVIATTHTKIVGGTIIDDRTYTWNRTHNKTQRKDVRLAGPQLTHDYTYDAIDRLVNTTVTGSASRTTAYTLDSVGNRTTVTGSPDPGIYTMAAVMPEPADDQMNQYTTTSFDSRLYDENSNLIAIDNALPSQKLVTYDYRNRMVDLSDSNTGQIHTYSYDPFGRRIEKVVDILGSMQTTRYIYDGSQVIEEQDDSGITQATYIYGLYFDEVLNMQRTGLDYYYHSDDLLNVMAVTDAAGNIVERYEYEDYGRPVDHTTLLPITGAPSAIGNPYYFTGRRYDPETSLYYYRTRYLDPAAGRFVTRDTIGIWGDPTNLGNAYTYVANNPWSKIDPMGLANDRGPYGSSMSNMEDAGIIDSGPSGGPGIGDGKPWYCWVLLYGCMVGCDMNVPGMDDCIEACKTGFKLCGNTGGGKEDSLSLTAHDVELRAKDIPELSAIASGGPFGIADNDQAGFVAAVGTIFNKDGHIDAEADEDDGDWIDVVRNIVIANNALRHLDEMLSGVGDDTELANVDLQKKLEEHRKLQMMMNIGKTSHDWSMVMVRKIE